MTDDEPDCSISSININISYNSSNSNNNSNNNSDSNSSNEFSSTTIIPNFEPQMTKYYNNNN